MLEAVVAIVHVRITIAQTEGEDSLLFICTISFRRKP